MNESIKQEQITPQATKRPIKMTSFTSIVNLSCQTYFSFPSVSTCKDDHGIWGCMKKQKHQICRGQLTPHKSSQWATICICVHRSVLYTKVSIIQVLSLSLSQIPANIRNIVQSTDCMGVTGMCDRYLPEQEVSMSGSGLLQLCGVVRCSSIHFTSTVARLNAKSNASATPLCTTLSNLIPNVSQMWILNSWILAIE